jgi:uncharacterized protein (DUF362 family)
VGSGKTRSRVAVIRTRPESVLDDVAAMMRRLDYARVIPPSRRTILKDNISWHLPFLSANTTPWQLEGVVRTLRQDGFHDLLGLHNQTVVTDAARGDRLNKFAGVYKRYQVPTLDNFSPDCRWVRIEPKARLLVLDRIFGEVRVPEVMIGSNIVHLPTVKTHVYTTMTGAIKNAFGGLLSTHRHYTHSHIHETIVDLLAIQKEIHTGIFALMDATTAGNGPGPRIMEPVEKSIILASGDQVAIDAVSAKMMGFDPMAIKYIRLAHEQGLGVGDPREIEIVGDDVSNESWGFKVGGHLHSFLGWLTWYGPTRFMQKVVTRPPVVAIPILFSEVFHDYYHWPLKERKIYERWLKDSQWGRLFARYASEGAQAPSTAPPATAAAGG